MLPSPGGKATLRVDMSRTAKSLPSPENDHA